MYIDLKPGNSYLLTRHSSKIEEQKIIWLLYNICWLKFNELSCFQSDSEKTLLLHIFYNILWLANITLSLRVPWSMNLYVNIQFLIVRIMDHKVEWFFPHWTDGVLNGLHCTRWKKKQLLQFILLMKTKSLIK